MSIIFNGTTLTDIIKDDVALDVVKYNNVEVFRKVSAPDLLLYRGTARGACDGVLGTATAITNNSGAQFTSVSTQYITGTAPQTWSTVRSLLYFTKSLTKAQLVPYKKIKVYVSANNTRHNELDVYILSPTAINASWGSGYYYSLFFKRPADIRGVTGYVTVEFDYDTYLDYLTEDANYIGVNCKMPNDYMYEIWLTA